MESFAAITCRYNKVTRGIDNTGAVIRTDFQNVRNY